MLFKGLKTSASSFRLPLIAVLAKQFVSSTAPPPSSSQRWSQAKQCRIILVIAVLDSQKSRMMC
jgi:hypothetical protein